MDEIRDQTFKEEVVVLDGRSFNNCHLIDCELRYSGGEFVLADTSMVGCKWTFGKAAQRTLTLMRTLRLSFGDEFKDQTADIWPLSSPIH